MVGAAYYVTLVAIGAAASTVGLHWFGVAPLGRHRPRYSIHWWWDALAHTTGGLAVAIVALFVGSVALSGLPLAAWTVGVVFVVGLAWELYERAFWDEHEKVRTVLYREDTTLDVALELVVTLGLLLVHQFVPLTPTL